MAQSAIIDKTNRVIKRLTTDSSPSFDSTTELAVTMSSPISLSGFMVLGVDNVTLTPATTAQVQAAGLDEAFNFTQKQQLITTYKNALTTAINSTTTANIRAVFQAMLALK